MVPHHLDADPDANLDSTYHPGADLAAYLDSDFLFDADPDPDSSLQIKVQTLEKVLS